MISLRKFWSQSPDESDPTGLMRVIRLLVQGIGLHAVESDPQEYQILRRDIQKLLEQIEGDPTQAELMMTIGAVLKELETYNARTTRHLRMQGTELYHMIAMLTNTVETLGSGSQRSLGELRAIETQIEKTSMLEDVRVLKLRLGECLETIRTEAERQKQDASRAVANLRQEIRESQHRISAAGAGPVLDPVTGVPARSAAAAALAESAIQQNPPFAALFVVDRVALLNARLGYAVGDRVLQAYLEELRTRLASADQIFRWSGPAFLVLLQRPERIEQVREQLRYAFAGKIERNFELSNRSVLLSISATWALFSAAVPVEDLMIQLDGFLATQNPAPQS